MSTPLHGNLGESMIYTIGMDSSLYSQLLNLLADQCYLARKRSQKLRAKVRRAG